MKRKIALVLGLSLSSLSLAQEGQSDDNAMEQESSEEATSTEASTEEASGSLPTMKTECRGFRWEQKTDPNTQETKKEKVEIVRRIWISYANDQGEKCEVHYDKPSENKPDHVLWSANSDPSFCQEKAKKLIDTNQSALECVAMK
ncbi:hypothetical protein [Pseudobacteriovorax antillogorgiicola]|uniref:Uncharacterized protein n=1 Tax=Pseudobacteriovorax antillogorgiicola TaxID=1513793 RepID=A0A1Y6C1P6_9BACT|nr:hypothetical protein [Pseudobacteriovorax antillogorgiicola]TCS50728.1 hypothetical protein EDD56_112111 [Pseudobacteriovorax antillogorgiicola]SMF40879.1 hypothetical protein SAMN06296036_112110 [Pseudobacteriovorax antillogorgiicola]